MEKLKSRNGGQWTEARFDGFITSILRSGTRRWAPKYQAVNDAKTSIKINKTTGRKAAHFKCASCKKDFPRTQIQVDHKEPIGVCATWDEFINRLFCEAVNLQILCLICHAVKTKKERTNGKEASVSSGRT